MKDVFLIQRMATTNEGQEQIERMAELLFLQRQRNQEQYQPTARTLRQAVFHYQEPSRAIQQLYRLVPAIGMENVASIKAMHHTPNKLSSWYMQEKAEGIVILFGEQAWLNDLGAQVAEAFFATQPAVHVTDEQNYVFSLFDDWHVKNKGTMDEGRVNRQRGPIAFAKNTIIQDTYRDFTKTAYDGKLVKTFNLHKLRP